MNLTRFLVTNFRSVENSGWVDVDNVTALIGVNESGKTNLLIPLWKLNPAVEGEIQPASDYPKKNFGAIRQAPGDYCFITAEFEAGTLARELSDKAGISVEDASLVSVKRYFNGEFAISFPRLEGKTDIDAAEANSEVKKRVAATIGNISDLVLSGQEEELKQSVIAKLNEMGDNLTGPQLSEAEASRLKKELQFLIPEPDRRTTSVYGQVAELLDAIERITAEITKPSPESISNVKDMVIAALPKFVYYSEFGNLDSEIYLPHVVQNLQRNDLGSKEAAKARTLRVLFKFVRLEPNEILELGQDLRDSHNNHHEPTPEEIREIALKKRERSILLQSAGASLTEKFRNWWKQGDYKFRFEADGSHFRIWVSDDRRPEEVELESRSTGLQWFLSFYLVFLVESEGEHQNAVLLLDEPGLSLHPLAQKNLSAFFENLANFNKILYTTHSPFLIDAEHLERARKVYVSENGTTRATPDLRHVEKDPRQAGAAYVVHSALNLNIGESLLLGCQPVIVQGPSDQYYLSAIKTLLIGANKISPKRELVFPPSGESRTAEVIAGVLAGRDEPLPKILLGSNETAKQVSEELKSGLYNAAEEKILSTDTYAGFTGSEVEDLIPASFFAQVIDRWERNTEIPFADVVASGKPLVGQVEAWAETQDVALSDGWRVEVAKRSKEQALKRGASAFDHATIGRWARLFQELIAVRN
ncbi:AAA family ATPase [Nitrosovibrio sp. Nv6]|uniref:AAA family ATPase n=1 Tax=Nitrosovibrio sp. Nv6 TaxID=1855340 RepID=UPI0008B2D266|nr:AAA family ATPase [Nitrosovibrio sp. Nv6]SEP39630.1 AAA ATPase domain-containing protein [Nitrosovibrio sp. Nv6]